MVQIRQYPLIRHLRSDPSRHVLHWTAGELKRSGRGLAYWFHPLSASIAEVPCDDQDISFLVHGRSSDFQEMTAQGVLTWRVTNPEAVAGRVDFVVDLAKGSWLSQPLEQMGDVLTSQVQQLALEVLASMDVREHMERGIEVVRDHVRGGLDGLEALDELGVEVVSVSVSKLAPTAELERALQTPAYETIQQASDEATFARRAMAVDKERAIAENELQNRIELATRESDLIRQQGQNARHLAEEEAEAGRIASEAKAGRVQIAAVAAADESRLTSQAEAEGIDAIEKARVGAERERIGIYRDLPARVLLGLAAREFAGKLERIDHLNLTPDLISNLLGDLMQAGTDALKGEGA